MIVACIKVGSKYSAEYVNKLQSMVARHTKRQYEFVCLTDDATGVKGYTIPINSFYPGWWAKLILFKPHPRLYGERVLYIDLDTVIVDNIDPLLEYQGKLAVIKDWWASGYNSSVMSIAPYLVSPVWYTFSPDMVQKFHGDQDWITLQHPNAEIWQEVAPGLIGSYKADNLEDGPREYSLICFHGEPKPHEFRDGWVADAWW